MKRKTSWSSTLFSLNVSEMLMGNVWVKIYSVTSWQRSDKCDLFYCLIAMTLNSLGQSSVWPLTLVLTPVAFELCSQWRDMTCFLSFTRELPVFTYILIYLWKMKNQNGNHNLLNCVKSVIPKEKHRLLKISVDRTLNFWASNFCVAYCKILGFLDIWILILLYTDVFVTAVYSD